MSRPSPRYLPGPQCHHPSTFWLHIVATYFWCSVGHHGNHSVHFKTFLTVYDMLRYPQPLSLGKWDWVLSWGLSLLMARKWWEIPLGVPLGKGTSPMIWRHSGNPLCDVIVSKDNKWRGEKLYTDFFLKELSVCTLGHGWNFLIMWLLHACKWPLCIGSYFLAPYCMAQKEISANHFYVTGLRLYWIRFICMKVTGIFIDHEARR